MVLWLKNQVDDLDLFCGPDGSASRAAPGPRAVGWKTLLCENAGMIAYVKLGHNSFLQNPFQFIIR
jgi:hypothetical protein